MPGIFRQPPAPTQPRLHVTASGAAIIAASFTADAVIKKTQDPANLYVEEFEGSFPGAWTKSGTDQPAATQDPIVFRGGANSLKIDTTVSGGSSYLSRSAASNLVTERFYVKITTLPTALCTIFRCTVSGGSTLTIQITANGTTGFRAAIGSDTVSSGVALNTGQWYRIDCTMDGTGASTRTITWALDGVQQTTVSNAASPPTFLAHDFGSASLTGVALNIDSIAADDRAAAFPIASVPFTADAVIKATQSGSFTADAVVLATTSASFTADAVIVSDHGIIFINRAVAGSNTVALPLFRNGDLGVVTAFRNASDTPPSLPAGWTNIDSAGANTASQRVGYRILQTADTDTGVWTNASSVQVLVFRRHSPSHPIGGFAANGASSASMAYLTFTLTDQGGTSWVLGVGGHRTATDVGGQTVSGMTTRSTGSSTVSAHTAENVASFSTATFTVNASSGWRTYAIEIRLDFATFTADAVIKTTQSASFTTDAVILATQSATFTADAVIFATQSASFTADAVIVVVVSGSFTADAILLATQSPSFTADAVVKSTISGSFTADAVIKKTINGQRFWDTFTGTNGTALPSHTPDVGAAWSTGAGSPVLSASNSYSGGTSSIAVTTIDDPETRFEIEWTYTYPSSGTTEQGIVWNYVDANNYYYAYFRSQAAGEGFRIFKRVASVETSVAQFAFAQSSQVYRARVFYVPGAVSAWVNDVLVVNANAISGLSDNAVFGVFARAVGTGNQLDDLSYFRRIAGGAGPETSFRADAIKLATTSSSFTANAIIKANQTSSFTADAIVKKTASATFTTDAVILATVSASFTADAVILTTQLATFTVDAVIFATSEATFTADAQIAVMQTGSFSTDAVIRATIEKIITADAVLLTTQSATISANAVLLSNQQAAFTGDAVILNTATASFTADAVILASRTGDFTADAYLFGEAAFSIGADAVLQATTTVAFTAQAVIRVEQVGGWAADAAIQRTQPASLTGNAAIHASQSATFTANAVIKSSTSVTFTGDAFVSIIAVYSFSAAAVIRATTTSALSGSAVLLTTQTVVLTADALVRLTSSATLNAEAVVRRTVAASFSTDAAIFGVTTRSFTAQALIDDGLIRDPFDATTTASAVGGRIRATTFGTSLRANLIGGEISRE